MRSTRSLSWIEALPGIGALLGLGPVPAPPHAFRLDAEAVTYAGFERRSEGLTLLRSERVELDSELFQKGLLGGPAREPAALQGRVMELMERLGDGAGDVDEASLVVPDAWMRLAFVDVADLPGDEDQRDAVLRWKLKRLVPFRVEELRLSAVEVEPLPEQSVEEPHRLLLGFAIDSLLAQAESAFAAAGVRIGRITCDSLALLAAVGPAGGQDSVLDGGPQGLAALVLVSGGGYSLVFVHRGEPVLHRYKGFTDNLPEGARGPFVERDLRLTRTFLEEHLPGVPLSRALVAAPEGVEAAWLGQLSRALQVEAAALSRRHLPALQAAAVGDAWLAFAPLLGAVQQEVA